MNKQEKILRHLLEGCCLVRSAGKLTLYKPKAMPLLRISSAKKILEICKKVEGNRFKTFVIDRRALQQLHGNDWRKKVYRDKLASRKSPCEPCNGIQIITLKNTQ